MEDHDDKLAAWLMLGITVSFKIGLTLFVLIAYPSGPNLITNLALNWPWLVLTVVLVIVLVGYAIWWLRLVRVRAKRARLLHGEWNVDSGEIATDRPRG
jgi:cytochrome bd-type quinol oxidase subunit 2